VFQMTKKLLSLALLLTTVWLLSSCSGIYRFRKNEYSIINEEIHITSINRFKGGELIIPDRIRRKPVTVIADGAFSGNEDIEGVYIPNTIERIEQNAFLDNRKLEFITFQENSNLEYIGASAFKGTVKLLEVYLPESVVKIDGLAFSNCTSLEQIYIPSSVVEISSSVLLGSLKVEIYTSHSEKPQNWHTFWNYETRPVFWNQKPE
jgi:hypothetical protein